jgi:peptidoglycan LD-endopeptidase CwlK
MASFGASSKAKLQTCHPKLQVVANSVIQIFNFTVVCGHRSESEQQGAYHARPQLSKARFGESPHNYTPSLAIDVAPYKNGGIDWNDTEAFTYLAGHFMGAAHMHGIALRWGRDWDGDEDLNDQTFNDYPHLELLNWKEELV